MAENPEKSVRNSRFLITGGLGFVGSAIARRLLREGAGGVTLFDQKKEPALSLEEEKKTGRLTIFYGDIRNKNDVDKAVSASDYVFHEAGLRVTRWAKEPRLAHEVMVDGTFNVVEACVEHGIKKIIFASSAIVYGNPLRLPLEEDHPTHDTTLYGIFKTANEDLLRSFREQNGLAYAALRYFNIYGPGMNLFGPEVEVLVRWLDRLDAGLAPLIFGDGKQTLDWVFIDDIVEANWRALLSGETGDVFNVCTGRETSLLELLEILLKVRGVKLSPEFREGRAVNQVSRRFGSPERARKRLGFSAAVSLEKGLKEFVEWRARLLAQKDREKMGQEIP